MNIVNISFNEINCKKNKQVQGQVNVANNAKIKSVEETKMNIDSSRKALKIVFEFQTDYQPDFASLSVAGELLLLADEKKAKEILDNWQKNKKLDDETAPKIINPIMNKGILEAVFLSRELDLPAPIPLPSMKKKDGESPNKTKSN